MGLVGDTVCVMYGVMVGGGAGRGYCICNVWSDGREWGW